MKNTKKCTKCQEIKDLTQFHKKGENFTSHCKACLKDYRIKNKDKILERVKNYRESNKEKVKETVKKCYEQHKEQYQDAALKRYYENGGKEKQKQYRQRPEVKERTIKNSIFYSAKKRAEKKNIDFDIEIEDITIPIMCPVLNIPLKSANNRMNDNSPTLDRIDNSKGYVKGNIQIISWRANSLKSNGTKEEFQQIIKYLEDHEKLL